MHTVAATQQRRSGRLVLSVDLFIPSLWAFLLSCLFDPADKVLGLKVWFFVLCWITGALRLYAAHRPVRVRLGLVIYVLVFILIPVASVAGYYMRGGGEPFDGVTMLKGYILISFALLLYITCMDLFDQLAKALTLLALCIVGTTVAIIAVPEFGLTVYQFGAATGMLSYDQGRDYGSDVVLMQVYFVTSPMLAIAIAYYYDRARAAPTRAARVRFCLLLAVNIVGMLLAGSRNNILIALALPVALWLLHSRRKGVAGLLVFALALLFLWIFRVEFGAFFDPQEHSNSAKLQLVNDYVDLFSSPTVFLFGQGLGAFHPWSPPKTWASVTELTYFELVRNFGIFGAAAMFVLLLQPLLRVAMQRTSERERTLAVGYAFYLIICASNPNLFSSMGILMLSLFLALPGVPPRASRNP